jgi:uncharacterized protein (DUF1684 family)
MGQVLKGVSINALAFTILLVACSPGQTDMSTDEHTASIEDWHAKRVESLKGPNGWLNIAGLFWLKEGMNTFGSGENNDIVFPAGKITEQAGYFTLRDGTVTMQALEGADITVKGSAVDSVVAFAAGISPGEVPRMEHGSLLWFVIKRDDQYGIRLRDFESDGINKFHGIERYPVDLRWRINARFEKADPGKTIDITNVLGQTTPNPSPGTLVFEIDDKEYRLDAIFEGSAPDYFIIFGDPTNEKETYPSGRYLYVDPADSSGMAIIDFNKSYNPPCAFTPFATCPLPPRQNVLPVPITAGEKNYGDHSTR